MHGLPETVEDQKWARKASLSVPVPLLLQRVPGERLEVPQISMCQVRKSIKESYGVCLDSSKEKVALLTCESTTFGMTITQYFELLEDWKRNRPDEVEIAVPLWLAPEV